MLLFSGRCIPRRFLGNFRLDRPRWDLCRPPLLSMAVFHWWFHGCSSRLRLAPPLPLPSVVGRRGVTKVRRPFQGPPAALPAPEVNEKGPGKSSPDRVSPLLRVGGFCQCIGGTGSQLERVRGCYPSCGMGIASPSWTLLLLPPTPRYRFRRTGRDHLGHWPCAKRSRRCCPRMPWRLSSIRIPASTVVFSWWKRRPVIDLSHLNEFIRQTPFKMETVASVLLSVREGDFLASMDLKDAYFNKHSLNVNTYHLPFTCNLPPMNVVKTYQ